MWVKKVDPQPLLDYLNRSTTPSPQQRGIAYSDIPGVDWAMSMLGGMLEFPEALSEMTKSSLIHGAVMVARNQGLLTLETLGAAVEAALESHLSGRPKPYVLLSSVSVARSVRLPTVRWGGAEVAFPRGPLPRYRLPEVLSSRVPDFILPTPANYLRALVRVTGRVPNDAGETAIDVLAFVRGVWNLALNIGRQRTTVMGAYQPINTVLPGPLYTLHHPGGRAAFDGYWYELYPGGLPTARFQAAEITRMIRNGARLRRRIAQSPFRRLLEDGLVRYCSALDDRDPASAFLQLWSLLETLTITQPGESHENTVNRASALTGDYIWSRLHLNHLRKIRNRAVHTGVNTARGDVTVGALKGHVENVMRFLIFNPAGLKDPAEVVRFLSLPCDPGILLRHEQLVRAMRRYRP